MSGDLPRPGLMRTGVAAAATGTVLLLLPKKAQKVAPGVTATPDGVVATKTFRF
jgi:hypothetical protein